MVRDEKTSKKIEANRKTLKSMGVPVHVVDVSAAPDGRAGGSRWERGLAGGRSCGT